MVVVAGGELDHLAFLQHILGVYVQHLANGRQVVGVFPDEVLHRHLLHLLH